jgi:hypothetical protein
MSAGSITIPANLVQYLRKGIKSQLAARLDRLSLQLEGDIDPAVYQQALDAFDEARAHLDTVGVADENGQLDLDIDLSDFLLKAMEGQYRVEAARLQDAERDGFTVPPREIPALGALVDDARNRLGLSHTSKQTESFLTERSVRRRRRSRGHG